MILPFGPVRVLLSILIAAAALAAGASGAEPAPDGVIVFERRSGTGIADLYRIQPDGSGLRRLTRTRDAFDPELSPDGRFVVFASDRTHGRGATELFVMRADGTGVRRLTRNAYSRRASTVDFDPTWSTDGETIVFSRTFVRGGRSSTDLFSIPPTGGPAQRLTYTAGRETSPTYSLLLQLAFVRGGFIYQRVGTGQIRQQPGDDPDWTAAHQFGAWSREGWVYRSSLDGEVSVGAGSEPTWSPDGRSLAWSTPLGLVVDGNRLTRTGNRVRDLSPSWGPLAR